MMPGPPGAMHGMRSLARDRSVTKEKISRQTLRRIGAFARPYLRLVTTLVTVLAVNAALGAANPLLFREIINKGIIGKDVSVIVVLSLVAAAIALLTGGATVVQRWISSKIGEGLIFDMRTRVFGHVQRMPIAFFTRTQTGALISRLNNDVLGAQQAFTTRPASNGVITPSTATTTLSTRNQIRSARCGRANLRIRRNVCRENGRRSDCACIALYIEFHAVTSMLMTGQSRTSTTPEVKRNTHPPAPGNRTGEGRIGHRTVRPRVSGFVGGGRLGITNNLRVLGSVKLRAGGYSPRPAHCQ